MPFILIKRSALTKKEITKNLLNNFTCEECSHYLHGSKSCECEERLLEGLHAVVIAHNHTCEYFEDCLE